MARLPEFSFYGNGSDQHNGRAIRFDIGPLTLFYSYQTIIGFIYKGQKFVSENVWSNTTGKQRLKHDEFKAKLDEVLKEMNINE